MKIKYPKENKVIRISNKKSEANRQTLEMENQIEKMKFQIDELETSQLELRAGKENSNTGEITGIKNRLTMAEQNISSNSIAITTANGNISQNSANIASLQSTVAGHTTQIGNNVNNIVINANDIANLKSQVSGLQNQQQINTTQIGINKDDIADIKAILAEYFNPTDPNKIDNEPLIEYADTDIITTYDCYERELEITKTTEILAPNVLFKTNTQVLESNQLVSATADIDITLNFIPSGVNGTTTFNIYDNTTLIGTYSMNYDNNQLGQTLTLSQTISNYQCSTFNHNLYIVCIPDNSLTEITLTYQKIEITAPNVVIINKVKPFDVEYNYYTDTYYLSDCSSGTAKICEIAASDLTKTNDIVWTDTGISAQSYKTYFTTVDNGDGTYSLGSKFAVVVGKDNKAILVREDGVIFSNSLPFIDCSCPQTKTALIYTYFNYLKKNTLYFWISTINSSTFKLNGTSFVGDTLDSSNGSVARNYTDYLNFYNPANYTSFAYKNTDFSAKFFGFASGTTNYVNKFFNNVKIYITSQDSSAHKLYYTIFFDYYGKTCKMNAIDYQGTITFDNNLYVIGQYDDYFMGVNDDYFCVVDGELKYFKNI